MTVGQWRNVIAENIARAQIPKSHLEGMYAFTNHAKDPMWGYPGAAQDEWYEDGSWGYYSGKMNELEKKIGVIPYDGGLIAISPWATKSLRTHRYISDAIPHEIGHHVTLSLRPEPLRDGTIESVRMDLVDLRNAGDLTPFDMAVYGLRDYSLSTDKELAADAYSSLHCARSRGWDYTEFRLKELFELYGALDVTDWFGP